MKHNTSNAALSVCVPMHWSPEQALATLECLHAMREAIWRVYGSQAQQAWCDQIAPDLGPLPDFDPDLPF